MNPLFIPMLFILIMILVNQMSNRKFVEANFKILYKHLNINPKDLVSPLVTELIKTGKNIKALKQIRKDTGFGLKESKDILMRVKVEIIKS